MDNAQAPSSVITTHQILPTKELIEAITQACRNALEPVKQQLESLAEILGETDKNLICIEEEAENHLNEMRNRYYHLVILIALAPRHSKDFRRDFNQTQRMKNMCITNGSDQLAPLVNFITGDELPHFPSDANAIGAVTETEIPAVLDELWAEPDKMLSRSRLAKLLREEVGLRPDCKTYQLEDM
ncbi:MAG: hypothetical protein MMC33_004204 [Icmadophila ericetorum]|nr:hypothetical protein [Icmadophila ericetorum]